MIKRLSCIVNGKTVSLDVDAGETLLEVLRNRLSLPGTKKGCEAGECGACTVLVDGMPLDSCLYLAVWAEGKTITTIEGLTPKEGLSPLQQNFVDEGAIQCGFCTPGMIVSAHALLENHPDPDEETIRYEMAGNFCRCTGYLSIVKAIQKTAADASKQ